MGKSTASCFKIISCGGSDSVDHDDLQTSQSKDTSDRYGWSFRKKSVKHRAVSNSVISESPATASKESPESTAVNFQVQPDLNVPEKSSVVQSTEDKTELPIYLESKTSEERTELSTHLDSKLSEEKTELSTHLDSKLSEIEEPTCPDSKLTVTEVSSHLDSKLSEEKTEFSNHLNSKSSEEKTNLSTHLATKLSDIHTSREDEIGIDATLDEQSIIVIQAAIRGLLAQQVLLKQKNIIKLQAVVRGHIVRRHAIGTLRCVQAIIKMQALVRARQAHMLVQESADLTKQRDSSGQRKKVARSSGAYAYVSIEKLLSNAFARQLMAASPRTIPINIKCEPLKSDSAWKWLERWVSVSSVNNEEVNHEQPQESGADVEQHNIILGHSNEELNDFVQKISKSTDSGSGVDALVEAPIDGNLTVHDMNDLNPSSGSLELLKIDQSNLSCDVPETAPIEMKDSELFEVVEVTNLSVNEETENHSDLTDLKLSSTQKPDTEVKKISRKASNPAFIAAQSRFEEMSLGATSGKLTTFPSHDPGVESTLDKVSSVTDQTVISNDTILANNAIFPALAVQRGDSECGTELSISSTLDSPNMSEAGGSDGVIEIKASDVANHGINGENLELEANSNVVETDSSHTHTNKLEGDEIVNSVAAESLKSSMETKPEIDLSHLVNKSSPEASPRSHTTFSESQVTPSSQVSVKPKKIKSEKSGSERKSRSSLADKNPSSHNQDLATRSSLEQLQEHKSGKRRNSFGSAKPDHREQEPRDSSSSNSLPSYMQATESARAKTVANSSPKSSPDVHDKDIYLKKRHSLPGTNERQGSPRIHRSLSHAQQNAKGSATHSPQDRKWRR